MAHMVVRVTTDFVMLGSVMQNVLHFNNPDGVMTLQQIAADITTNWITALRSVTDDNGSWTRVTVRNLNDPTQAVFVHPIAITGGADFGNSQIPFAGAVLIIGTARFGRHGKGRVYHPASTNAWLLNGVVTASARTSWNHSAVLGHIRNAYIGPSSTISPLSLGVLDKAAGVLTDATSIDIRSTFGSQRRRNVGVGI